ncbi:sulfite exporter TauE/SafE family protein [Verrucomicrobium spinosum]|uniref:sulfite exporter TauE/SafE family protein n=1 Tax=Verrucomicrobium spinosum TaxID=2736 RepID=UPI00017446EB|nr:sulfite exporter TauE/SafE family protein [Verrucomicrobium spinosum]
MAWLELSNAASLNVLLLTGAVFVLAGVVKGVIGLGLPTVAVALLALVMSPAEAAALLVVPSFVTNVWQIWPWGTLGPMLKRLGGMQIGIVAGSLLGAWILGAPAGKWAMVGLGTALIGYAGWALTGARMTVRSEWERWLGPLIGGSTGFVTAATGVFVIPAVPYLQALGLKKDELIQGMGISFTVSTVVLALGLVMNGSYPTAVLGSSALMLVPALIGMYAGTFLRSRLSPAKFRICFLAGLIALGVHLVVGK